MADIRAHPEQDQEHEVTSIPISPLFPPAPRTPPPAHSSSQLRSPEHILLYSTSANIKQGASTGEILIEAARRNNTDLLEEVIAGCKSPEEAAKLLNETRTVLGNYAYHEAALNGNCMFYPRLLRRAMIS
jgi:hypothetical protein